MILKDKTKLVSFFLRSGIGIAFLYAAIASTLNPTSWQGFIPLFITNILPANLFLRLFSLYELTLFLWLISGKKIRYAGIVSIITLIGIIIFNIGAFEILFRDVAIIFAAIALTVLTWNKK